MPLLNTANNVYLGSSQVDKVYLGSNLIWPSGASVPESLFQPGTVPAIVETGDTAQVNLGTIFDSQVAGTVSAIWVWVPPNPGAGWNSLNVMLWSMTSRTTGSLLGNGVVSGAPTPNAWNRIPLITPVAISANTPYIAAMWRGTCAAGTGCYGATVGFCSIEKTNGLNLRCPADSDDTYYTDIRNGRYTYSGSVVFPASDFSAAWFGVDLEFTAS